jgi:hypothetical protein
MKGEGMECQRIPVSPLASHTAHVLHTLNKEMGVLESINIQAQALINLSPLKMIPDFKQQISELERQKQDLESRLKEQAEKIEGNVSYPGSVYRPQQLGNAANTELSCEKNSEI